MASSKCCNFHAGMLRHTISIEERVLSPRDEGGGSVMDWNAEDPFAEDIRAFVKPTSGREWLHASQLKGLTTHEVVIRYISDLTTDMRVKYGTRYFNIRMILNVEERNRWYVLQCEEGVAQ